MSKDLRIALKAIYFEQIKSGEKTEEYRVYNDFWRKRIEGKVFDTITLTLGYPKSGDKKRELKFTWNGYEVRNMLYHPETGKEEKVFAISLKGKKLN